MSIMVNGQSFVPPGFRFHPTEEELLNYYLRKKVASEKIDLDVIRDVDLNKLEPWDILEKCRIGSTPQNDWYFFSHKDKKYPTGTRTNRATAAGFWKATGRDKVIYASSERIGMRKTLVFYKGRAPHGHKSDWIMHEYRLDENSDCTSQSNALCSIGDLSSQEDGWVVCRVFKKKNLQKAIDSPNNCSSMITGDAKSQLMVSSSGDGALEQILQYMGRSCKQETEAAMITNNNMNISNNSSSGYQQTTRHLRPIETLSGASFSGGSSRFMKLPPLESLPSLIDDFPTADYNNLSKSSYQPEGIHVVVNSNRGLYQPEPDWAALDRLAASHLNGQSEASKQLACLDVDSDQFMFSGFREDHSSGGCSSGGDGDLWSLASCASDHISHVSHESI